MSDLNQASSEMNSTDQPHKSKRWIVWSAVLLICVGLLLPLLHRSRAAQLPGGGPPGPGGPFGGSGSASVNVAKVTPASMDIYLDALGTVTPLNTVNVYSLVNGRILSVSYREGQMVEKGQELVEIDPLPYEAQLKQAAGTLKRDQALLEQARTDLARYQEALKENALAQQMVFDEEQTVKQYEATVENDQGVVDYDKVQLSYCQITAPSAGRIGLRLVDPGNTIFSGATSTIAVITQLNPVTVVFSIPEDRVQDVQRRVAHGETMKVDLYDRTQATKLATGTLLTLDNAVDTTTGTVRLRALFDNPSNDLFPNQFVNVRLRVDTLKDTLTIPTVAIQYNGQQAFVYKLNAGNVASIQNLTVLNTEQNRSAITGLNAGDRVVTNNFDRVEDGAVVALASAGPGMADMPQGGPPTDARPGATPGKNPTPNSAQGSMQ